MELGFKQSGLIPMHCDNQSAIYIVQKLMFHKRTKHIEVDCHLVREAWTKKVISLPFTLSSKQLVELIRAASPRVFSNLCSKLGMIYICSNLTESVI